MAMMSCSAAIVHSLVCFIVFLNAAAHVEVVEAHRAQTTSSDSFHWYYPFVFGDSFADTGNLAKSNLSRLSRQWYSPYGNSRPSGRPSGRFSDGFVQSDLVGRILGRSKAPVAYRLRGKHYSEAAGINYAVAGAGVYEAPTLSMQIFNFMTTVMAGTVTKWQLKNSVALVAVSGNDYDRLAAAAAKNNNTSEIVGFIGNVTDEIAKGVNRLREVGVAKVLVNTLHPLACTPWQSRASNYTECVGLGNVAADLHNAQLREKLNASDSDSVYLLDLNRAFTAIINPSDTDTVPQVAKRFKEKLKPCCDCESVDAKDGYCGEVDEDGGARYSVCTNPEKHFFWDDVHPTQAGWEAVMGQLERDIKDFLHISY